MKLALLLAALALAGCSQTSAPTRDVIVVTPADPEPAPVECKLGRYEDGACVRPHD